MTDRIIGKYKGKVSGPLLVITAAMHGNEPAGVKALNLLFKMLEVEPITNPDFVYKGEIIGIIGNVQAYQKGQRFIEKAATARMPPALLAKAFRGELVPQDSNDEPASELLRRLQQEAPSPRAKLRRKSAA